MYFFIALISNQVTDLLKFDILLNKTTHSVHAQHIHVYFFFLTYYSYSVVSLVLWHYPNSRLPELKSMAQRE